MQQLRKSILLICFGLILVMTFSMGAAAAQNRQIENEGSVGIMSESGNSFFLCGNEIDLPAAGAVIYGTVDNLSGTTGSLTASAFTSLTAGTDYTWWIYYDEANANYCLFFDGFVMTSPYSSGSIVFYAGDETFDISVTDSTLLDDAAPGEDIDYQIIYTAGAQNLSIDHSTLIQNSNCGHISCCDSDLTVMVNDSVLTAMNDDQTGGGNIFIVNYASDINACALTVMFSGENTVTCYWALLNYFNNNENSSATLVVNDDFSYTTYHDEAIESCGDVTINVTEDATLALRALYNEDDESGNSAIVSLNGDVMIFGGGTVNLESSEKAIYADEGSIDISNCTLNAYGDDVYGALSAGSGINYHDLYLLSPENGVVEQIIRYWIYAMDENDHLKQYVKTTSLDGSEAYYYNSTDGIELTEAEFNTAIDSALPSYTEQFYTVSDALLPSSTFRVAPDQSQGFTDDESWADWAEPYVIFAINDSLMGSNSVSKLYFDANATTNRAMMAKILYNLAGDPEVTAADIAAYNNKFSDVQSTAWYYDAVVWATVNGIVNGVDADTFAPMSTVSRQQAVTMLWRFDGSTDSSYSLSDFSDHDKVNTYAQTAFAWAVENGIINGMPSGDNMILSPKTGCTRAQMAVILTKYVRFSE